MAVSLSFVKKIAPKSIDAMAIAEVVDRVETLNQGIAEFWSKSDGWAPVAAAGLLGKSRLDWQASLSGSLRLWMREPPNALTPAELILAWANLGSLVEGTDQDASVSLVRDLQGRHRQSQEGERLRQRKADVTRSRRTGPREAAQLLQNKRDAWRRRRRACRICAATSKRDSRVQRPTDW